MLKFRKFLWSWRRDILESLESQFPRARIFCPDIPTCFYIIITTTSSLSLPCSSDCGNHIFLWAISSSKYSGLINGLGHPCQGWQFPTKDPRHFWCKWHGEDPVGLMAGLHLGKALARDLGRKFHLYHFTVSLETSINFCNLSDGGDDRLWKDATSEVADIRWLLPFLLELHFLCATFHHSVQSLL